jgi:hypothetical protein
MVRQTSNYSIDRVYLKKRFLNISSWSILRVNCRSWPITLKQVKESIKVMDRVDIKVGKRLDCRFSVTGFKSFGNIGFCSTGCTLGHSSVVNAQDKFT